MASAWTREMFELFDSPIVPPATQPWEKADSTIIAAIHEISWIRMGSLRKLSFADDGRAPAAGRQAGRRGGGSLTSVGFSESADLPPLPLGEGWGEGIKKDFFHKHPPVRD